MIINKLFRQSTIYKTYDFFKSWIYYAKVKKSAGTVFYSEEFKTLMRKYLKVDLKEDWIGRLYGVINPTINEKGQLDFSSMVIELDGNDTNNSDWVNTWIYKQLNLVSQLFKIEHLYDFINLDIKHVGPVSMDNYLIVFDLIARKSFTNSAKSLLKNLSVLAVIAIVCLIIFV